MTQPRPKVTIFPAADGGITATFPHQSANLPASPGSLWHLGNPCLERPEAAFKRDEVTGEPDELSERIIWRVGRLLSWIDAAAAGRLLTSDDPVELPSFNTKATPVLGFIERREDLPGWIERIGKWGFARTGAVRGAYSHRQIIDFMSEGMHLFKEEALAKGGCDLPVDAIWIMLLAAPIVAPWQCPRTWRELSTLLDGMEIDLSEIFRDAGSRTRMSSKTSLNRLLLGFPLQEKIGHEPERVHWVAAEHLGLSDSKTSKRGFRPMESNRLRWDAAKALSADSIRWVKTSNWASDQIRTRGEAEDVVKASRVLIIGAGAIGSAVAESLARSGVCQIGIIDNDLLEVGNLSRHTLGVY